MKDLAALPKTREHQPSTMRIYLESTIPSYVTARPARDLLQAARQQLTRDWWDLKRDQHELFTSQVVLDEIGFGEKAVAERRLEMMQAVPLLRATDEVKELARKVLDSGLLPATATAMRRTLRWQAPTKWISY